MCGCADQLVGLVGVKATPTFHAKDSHDLPCKAVGVPALTKPANITASEETMTSPQKNKGDRFERDIRDYLLSQGFNVERTRAGWADDRGDIHGIAGFTWECKNQKALSLSAWVGELESECRNAGTSVGAVVHKKRGVTDGGEQYATLPLRMLVQLLKEAGYR